MHWWAWLAGRWPDSQNGDRVVFNEALTCIQPRSVGAAVLMLWKLQVSTRNQPPQRVNLNPARAAVDRS
jgi:hypothetical protein